MRSVLCLVLVVFLSSCCALKGKKQCKMDCAKPCCAVVKAEEAAPAAEAAVVEAAPVAAAVEVPVAEAPAVEAAPAQ